MFKPKEECPPAWMDQFGENRSSSVDENLLYDLYKQLNGYDLRVNLARLAILAKDLSEYIAVQNLEGEAVSAFRNTWFSTVNKDRLYWEEGYPWKDKNKVEVFMPLASNGLPNGMTAKVANGVTTDIDNMLCDDKIEQDWARFLGWSFFKHYSKSLGDVIEKEITARDWEELRETDARVLKLAKKIMESYGKKAFYLALIALYTAMLLVRTGFGTLAGKRV